MIQASFIILNYLQKNVFAVSYTWSTYVHT